MSHSSKSWLCPVCFVTKSQRPMSAKENKSTAKKATASTKPSPMRDTTNTRPVVTHVTTNARPTVTHVTTNTRPTVTHATTGNKPMAGSDTDGITNLFIGKVPPETRMHQRENWVNMNITSLILQMGGPHYTEENL